MSYLSLQHLEHDLQGCQLPVLVLLNYWYFAVLFQPFSSAKSKKSYKKLYCQTCYQKPRFKYHSCPKVALGHSPLKKHPNHQDIVIQPQKGSTKTLHSIGESARNIYHQVPKHYKQLNKTTSTTYEMVAMRIEIES